MKEGYWALGALVLFHFGRLLYLYYQKRQNDKGDREIADTRFDAYLKLREETFALKPEDLHIPVSATDETAFAAILEIHNGSAIQALVAFTNGHVWAFNTNNARKNIWDDSGDTLKARAQEALRVAQYNFARMRRNNAEKLLPGHAKLHILTDLDIYSIDGPIIDMLTESSRWYELISKMWEIGDELDEVTKNNPIKQRAYTNIKVKRSRPANL